MRTLNEAIGRDALLVIWDILGDLNAAADDDPEVTKKLDQLRHCIDAMDIPKGTARKAREAVDDGRKNPVLAAPTDGETA